MLVNKDLKKIKNKYKKNELINNSKKSIIKNFIRKINIYLLDNNKEELKKIFIKFQSYIDSQSSKRLIHKNKVSRYKSRIMKKINNLTI
ncbi:30S ribosomal protein S20 [endosymbiont of Pachyrhynchus infernalis]|uniref:30S ribosomal protein S20 n=1 Tax=endosymbiont of Pachyrhynchus infernalis TaxID=1971488 RepID=UPI000DC6DACF|nr:30S ribosomal protein S20 [endosymbiont of Pachyrhynchus infernalis]BBA84906.1 30S ribosomal protein S20 [endosymbiont of Pachyrhynchus infernalis]